MEKIKILIVNYNTEKLLLANIKSIIKTTKNVYFYIFDNSDKEVLDRKKIDELNIEYTIIDNTNGKIIDFSKELNFGSVRHTLSVNYCFDFINDKFILLDSDVIVKRDLRELVDDEMIFVGSYQNASKESNDRLKPYCCFINVPLCKKYNIHFYYKEFSRDSKPWYDTGGAFYKFAKKYKHKFIDINLYINHLVAASWTNKNQEIFLLENEKYFK